MKAIILSAGLGSRLKTLTEDIPKALIKVNGIPLIDYAINFVKDRVDQIVVVGGYCFHLVKDHLESKKIDKLVLVENPDYKEGSILTVEKALNYIDDSFLLMNVDHIYPRFFMDEIIKQINGLSGICDFDRSLVADDMKIKLNNERQIIQIDKKLTEFDGGYIGMTSCDKKTAPLYKDMVKKAIELGGRKVNVEFVLQLFANEKVYPNVTDLSGSIWLEVDDENDLNKAEAQLKAKPDFF